MASPLPPPASSASRSDAPSFEDRVAAVETWFASLPLEHQRLLEELAELDKADAEPQRHHP